MFKSIVRLFRWFSPHARVIASLPAGEVVYELPFEPASPVYVVQGYGGTYSHTAESYYSIDFDLPENSCVCAARAGVVFQITDYHSTGGTDLSFKPKANAIYILHADDTLACYAHLAHRGASASVGQFVSVGQPIGFSGNTGWSSRPHLHFHLDDAAYHLRRPTHFRTIEQGTTILHQGNWYTRPKPPQSTAPPSASSADSLSSPTGTERNPHAFSPELFSARAETIELLQRNGFDEIERYASVDLLHDVHGLEVCGIVNPEDAMQITRLLMGHFRGWSPGRLHPPDNATDDRWIASIQRDRDPQLECWKAD